MQGVKSVIEDVSYLLKITKREGKDKEERVI
jgi:hypothetical protein